MVDEFSNEHLANYARVGRGDEPGETRQAKVGRNAILVTQTQEITVELMGLSGNGSAVGTLAELERFVRALRGLGALDGDIITGHVVGGNTYGKSHVLRAVFPMRDLYPR